MKTRFTSLNGAKANLADAKVWCVLFLVFLAVGPALGLRAALSAPSADFIVNSTLDQLDAAPGDTLCSSIPNGLCTLRAAIMEANALAGADTITLPEGTFTLTIAGTGEDLAAKGDLDITDDLILTGAGWEDTIIDGGSLDRIFDIDPASAGITVEISGVRIRNGSSVSGGGIYNKGTLTLTGTFVGYYMDSNTATGGGGIYNEGTLTLTGSYVGSNTAIVGGGILNSGTLTLIDALVGGNTASNGAGGGIYNSGTLTLLRGAVGGNMAPASNGGGIYSSGTLRLTDTVVLGNDAGGVGGGIYGPGGTLSLTNVGVYYNTAGGGGGIFNDTGVPADLTNSTLSGNTASGLGGGLDNFGTVTLTNVTVSDNTAAGGSGIMNEVGGTVTLKNTIVSNNPVGNCGGSAVTSLGYNLDSGNTCGFAATGDLTNTDPLLGPLAYNGGPFIFTLTHALLVGSPAIDAGDNVGCPTTDQRGEPRPVDGDLDGTATCDIGAFERGWRIFLPLLHKNFGQ